jgi:alpha-galactosidase
VHPNKNKIMQTSRRLKIASYALAQCLWLTACGSSGAGENASATNPNGGDSAANAGTMNAPSSGAGGVPTSETGGENAGGAAATTSAGGAGGTNATGGTNASGGANAGGAAGANSGAGGVNAGGSAGNAGMSGANAGGTAGASAGLAATPPMGWNNFNHFVDNFTHVTFEQAADAMVSSGLKAAGYEYINIDDSWDKTTRDAQGNLVVDPAKFPNGIKALADYVHARGLKLGIYADRGLMTCSKFPGSYGHEAADAALFASFDVDYVKVDNCYPNTGTTAALDRVAQLGGTVDGITPSARYQAAQQVDYTNWANALHAAGRPMLFSICAWWFYNWEPTVGNMFRTTKDTKANWTSFLATLDGNGGDTTRYTDANFPAPGISKYAGPGHWNDPDMLEVGNAGLTDTEQRAQFSLWAIMAAPLILGNDLTNMSAATLATLSNAEVIAVDQDPLGKQGVPVSASTTLEVWTKPLSGSKTYAVALFNRTGNAANITVTWNSLGLTGSASVRDLWAKQDLGVMPAEYVTSVPSHAVVLLRVVGQ